LPYYRPLLPALCLLTFSLAFTPHNLMEAVKLEGEIRMIYGWLLIFCYPPFNLGGSFALAKGGKEDK